MFANVQVAVFILFTVAFSLLVIRKSNLATETLNIPANHYQINLNR